MVRLKALIVDIFIVAMPLLYGATYLILGGKEEFQNNPYAIFGVWAVYGAITVFLQAKFAQTPGLKSQNAYLIDTTCGKKAKFPKLVLRFLLFWCFGWLFLICLFRKDGLNIHDLLTKTAVVVKKDS